MRVSMQKSLLSKMHGHNFELRGKVADLLNAAMKQMIGDARENQTSITTELNEVKNRLVEVREKVVDPRSLWVLAIEIPSSPFPTL